MWKYVTRRFRDTFERSANHFDKRPTTNIVNAPGNVTEDKKKSCLNSGGGSPCPIQAWFGYHDCFKKNSRKDNTNNNRWNFEQLNRSWIGAITWSSALALGWYTSQLIHLKVKHLNREDRRCNINNLISSIKPYVNSVNNRTLFGSSSTKIENIVKEFTPTVHLVANERNRAQEQVSHASGSTLPDSSNSDSDLGEVLNSIENKLGIAAIKNGQHEVGLNLLRSAANRHHAPAMFNLGLCYEEGLGVIANEKTAMELYRSAAALQHPPALYSLGIYYGQGRGGLPCDLETATRLLRLAAVQGQQDAINALKHLEIEIEPPRVETQNTWIKHQDTLLSDGSVISVPTALFVENVLFAPHKAKATVY